VQAADFRGRRGREEIDVIADTGDGSNGIGADESTAERWGFRENGGIGWLVACADIDSARSKFGRTVRILLIGQVLSSLLCGTAIFSEYLSNKDFAAPTMQSFPS
jgi:hypothetical protein